MPIEDGELDGLFAPLQPFALLILAVSGGDDSTALMHLVARWSQKHPDDARSIVVATVDHGLRAASRREAEWVGNEARALGLAHEILTWEGPHPATGVQDAARRARYRLLGELAWRRGARGPVAIVTAHTRDDQAETLLMRLARGSGLDGLTGMSPGRLLGRDASWRLVRPLLAVAGARLTATLRARGLAWLDDPSNDSARFERARLRVARSALEALGLTSDKLALSASRLARARAALERATDELASAAALDVHGGIYASFDAHVVAAASEELTLRLMARLAGAFGGQDEPVRLARLEALVGRMRAPDFAAATLAGCIITRHGAQMRVMREPRREPLPQLKLRPGERAVWDRRFGVAVAAGLSGSVTVKALGGETFAALRRELDLRSWPPAIAASTVPAFWDDNGVLMSVPPLRALPGAPAAWSHGAGALCSAEFLG